MSWVLLAIFVTVSHPAGLPTAALIIPFIMVYAAVLYSTQWFVEYWNRSKLSGVTKARRRIPPIVASVTVLVIALQSIGQLTVRDASVVFLVFALSYFYLNRNGERQE